MYRTMQSTSPQKRFSTEAPTPRYDCLRKVRGFMLVAERILAHLGLPTERPVIAPARSPPQLDFDEDFGDPDFGDVEFDVN